MTLAVWAVQIRRQNWSCETCNTVSLVRTTDGGWGTHKRHPLLVEDVSAVHVGRDVAADGVTDVLGTVGVELSSGVTLGLKRQRGPHSARLRRRTMFILVPSQKP